MYKIYNFVIERCHAEEIAKDMNFEMIADAALHYLNEVCEEYTEEERLPKYSRYMCSGGGMDIYYDYGADYYFAVVAND